MPTEADDRLRTKLENQRVLSQIAHTGTVGGITESALATSEGRIGRVDERGFVRQAA